MGKKEVPVLVKIIAVCDYIGAGFSLIIGLLFLFASSLFSSLLTNIPALRIFGSALFVIAGIFMLGCSVLNFFMGRGLWMGKNGARILVIILSCLGVFGSLVSIISGQISNGIFGLLIDGLIGGYLLFNKEVKKVFEK